MKFDELTKEYYITQDDIVENSTIGINDIAQEWQGIDNIDLLLKEQSERVYRMLYDAIRVGDPQRHAKTIRYMVHESERKQYFLMKAIIEFIREQIETGERNMSKETKTILRQSGLYITGEIAVSLDEIKEW